MADCPNARHRAVGLTERAVGLALVLVSLALFWGTTLLGSEAGARLLGGGMALLGVVTAFFGMPLLVTGRSDSISDAGRTKLPEAGTVTRRMCRGPLSQASCPIRWPAEGAAESPTLGASEA
jgi:hypothetical protein